MTPSHEATPPAPQRMRRMTHPMRHSTPCTMLSTLSRTKPSAMSCTISNTIINIANYLYRTWAKCLFTSHKRFAAIFLAVFALTGCSALPDKPTRATVYDFGPGAVALQPASRQPPVPNALPSALPSASPPVFTLAPLALDEVQASAALDSTAVLYRLAYADAQALRPYAQARWSMTPAQLLRQRLREHLGLRRAVLNAGEGSATVASAMAIVSGVGGVGSVGSVGAVGGASAAGANAVGSAAVPATAPALLRIELEEFSQLFESPTASTGLLRLRATAVQPSAQGERLMGQRSFIVQRPAPSADAAGGVRALTAATDAAVEEIDQWLQQLR